jgi:hypothetical protein
MERRHIKWLPLLAVGVFLLYQYCSSEKFVNPETGRKSHVGMSTQQEAALGLQTYQSVLQQSEAITSGPDAEMVKRVASRLARATGQAERILTGRSHSSTTSRSMLSAFRAARSLFTPVSFQ